MSGTPKTTEVRVKGRWVTVPCLIVNANEVYASGRWLRIARIRGEEMMKCDLERPESYVEALRGNGKEFLKADIFTFTQKLPATQPRYSYPFERESVAAIELVGFKRW